jgi:hypothetical protein
VSLDKAQEEMMYLSKYQSRIIHYTEDASKQLIGCQVKLNTIRAKKYNGRLGAIHGVIPDRTYGLMVLVMVFYKGQTHGGPGSKAYLNSHRLTRSYWSLKSVIFTGEIAFR